MFNHRTIAALTAVAALTGSAGASAATPAPGGLGNATLGSVIQSEQAKIAAITGSAAASAATSAAGGLGSAPIGSVIQNEQGKVAGLGAVVNAEPGNATLGSGLQNEQAKAAALGAALNAGGTNCRAWRVNGQTWFAGQGSYTLMFTLRMASSTSSRISARSYASYYDGDPNDMIGEGSQYVSGGVVPDTGAIHLDIVWKNGTSGQYNGTAYNVQRTPSGGLTASLQGTAVDTTGNGGPGAHWLADGVQSPYLADGIQPLYCKPGDVVR